MDAPVPAAAAPADGEHAANAAAAEAAPGPPSGSWPVLPKGFVLAGQYQIQVGTHLSACHSTGCSQCVLGAQASNASYMA